MGNLKRFYTIQDLPIATASNAGVIKPGNCLSVTVDGTLNVDVPQVFNDVINGYLQSNSFYKDAEKTTQIPGEQGKIYINNTDKSLYIYDISNSSFISKTINLNGYVFPNSQVQIRDTSNALSLIKQQQFIIDNHDENPPQIITASNSINFNENGFSVVVPKLSQEGIVNNSLTFDKYGISFDFYEPNYQNPLTRYYFQSRMANFNNTICVTHEYQYSDIRFDTTGWIVNAGDTTFNISDFVLVNFTRTQISEEQWQEFIRTKFDFSDDISFENNYGEYQSKLTLKKDSVNISIKKDTLNKVTYTLGENFNVVSVTNISLSADSDISLSAVDDIILRANDGISLIANLNMFLNVNNGSIILSASDIKYNNHSLNTAGGLVVLDSNSRLPSSVIPPFAQPIIKILSNYKDGNSKVIINDMTPGLIFAVINNENKHVYPDIEYVNGCAVLTASGVSDVKWVIYKMSNLIHNG